MDTTRIADGQQVYMKRVGTGSDEAKIAAMLSSAALCNEPANHCVPVLSIFQDDEDSTISYMVMPLLRDMNDPPFQFVNDIVVLVDQLMEVRIHRISCLSLADKLPGP